MNEAYGIDCPKCGESTTSMVVEGHNRRGQIWKCATCRGMWLDQAACELVLVEDQPDEVRAFIRGSGLGKTLPPRPAEGGYRVSARRTGDAAARCAECGHELVAYQTSERLHGVRLRLDVCRGHGTWFDRGEAAQFLMASELRRYGSHGPLADHVPGDQWPHEHTDSTQRSDTRHELPTPPQEPTVSPDFYQHLVADVPLRAPTRPRTSKADTRDPDQEWSKMMNELSRLAGNG